jgi:probable HAF family extracellular repeat protein
MGMRRSVALVASAVLASLLASGVVIFSVVLFEGLDAQPARAAAAATTYTYTDLGTLTDVSTRPGMGNTIARGVNTSGEVVGHSQQLLGDGSLGLRAFYWVNGSKMLDLGTLPPEDPTSPGPTSAARGINDKGQVVGFSRVLATGTQQEAFVANKDAGGMMLPMSPLGTLPKSPSGEAFFPSSEAFAINEKGQIVGRSMENASPPGGPQIPISSGRAFLYQDGEMKDLGALPNDSLPEKVDPYSEAWAINDRGQVVGESGTDEDHGKAFLYTPGGSMKGLDTLPGQPYSEAFGIDNSGQIVGWSYSSRAAVQGRAFIYRNGKMEDLGSLPDASQPAEKNDPYSMARAIDEHGRVVGQSRAASGTIPNRAFLWENGQMTDLNSLVTSFSDPLLDPPLKKLLDAYAISESGQIVGSALNTKDKVRAYLLTPNDTTAPNTTATISPDPKAGWNKEDVTITLDATDEGGSNVKEITYSATGVQPIKDQTMPGDTTKIEIKAEGETTLTYYATDHAGNPEEPKKTLTVKIDKTAPKVTYDDNGASVNADFNDTTWRNTPLSKEFTASDVNEALDVSGIDLANSSPALTNNTFTLTASDESASAADPTTVSQTVKDVAGNSTMRKLSALIDKTAPNSSATATVPDSNADADNDPDPYSSGNWTNQNVTVSLSADDGSGSGVNVTKYTTNGDNPATNGTNYTGAFTISAEGTTTVKYLSTDKATNQESTKTFTVKTDKSAPKVSSCSVTPSKLSTSANNHKLVTVKATAPMLTDSGGSGPNGLTLFSVTSSQADSGLGPDDVPNDIQGWTTGTNLTNGQLGSGKLRAERYDGARVYTLTYQGKDLAGNTAECKPTVTVPKGG